MVLVVVDELVEVVDAGVVVVVVARCVVVVGARVVLVEVGSAPVVVVVGRRMVLVEVVEVIVVDVALSAQMKMRPFSWSALMTAVSPSVACVVRSRQKGTLKCDCLAS